MEINYKIHRVWGVVVTTPNVKTELLVRRIVANSDMGGNPNLTWSVQGFRKGACISVRKREGIWECGFGPASFYVRERVEKIWTIGDFINIFCKWEDGEFKLILEELEKGGDIG